MLTTLSLIAALQVSAAEAPDKKITQYASWADARRGLAALRRDSAIKDSLVMIRIDQSVSRAYYDNLIVNGLKERIQFRGPDRALFAAFPLGDLIGTRGVRFDLDAFAALNRGGGSNQFGPEEAFSRSMRSAQGSGSRPSATAPTGAPILGVGPGAHPGWITVVTSGKPYNNFAPSNMGSPSVSHDGGKTWTTTLIPPSNNAGGGAGEKAPPPEPARMISWNENDPDAKGERECGERYSDGTYRIYTLNKDGKVVGAVTESSKAPPPSPDPEVNKAPKQKADPPPQQTTAEKPEKTDPPKDENKTPNPNEEGRGTLTPIDPKKLAIGRRLDDACDPRTGNCSGLVKPLAPVPRLSDDRCDPRVNPACSGRVVPTVIDPKAAVKFKTVIDPPREGAQSAPRRPGDP